jgi:hypothetical protein
LTPTLLGHLVQTARQIVACGITQDVRLGFVWGDVAAFSRSDKDKFALYGWSEAGS